MPETLYSLGKAESQGGNYAAAEKAWKHVIELDKTGDLASQAHFGLSGVYRKQGTEDAARKLMQFQDTLPARLTTIISSGILPIPLTSGLPPA